MIDKIKHSLSLGKDEAGSSLKIPPELISIFQSEDIKSSRQTIDNIKETLNFLSEIANNNKNGIQQYIAQQVKDKQQAEDPDEKYTFLEDLVEIKGAMDTILSSFKQLQATQLKIQSKVEKLTLGKVDDAKYNAMEIKCVKVEEQLKKSEEELKKSQVEIKKLQDNHSINSELLANSKQQGLLLNNQVKQLQDKVRKIEKQLSEKSHQITNLQEEKTHLLNLKNVNLEAEALKNQLSQTQKRMATEKSKVQQKQKEIEQLKKRVEEEKNNLDSMADTLKESSFKQQQIAKKYENSKVEIRKYREQKIQQIKKLNDQMLEKEQNYKRTESEINDLKNIIKNKEEQIANVKSNYSNIVSSNIKQTNLEEQLNIIDQNLKQSRADNQEKRIIIDNLENELVQLKEKRQSLLKLIEQPIKHQIGNLQKIHKHMEILYKDYIMEVFEQGNVVGFERKIKEIMANVMELREDLLM